MVEVYLSKKRSEGELLLRHTKVVSKSELLTTVIIYISHILVIKFCQDSMQSCCLHKLQLILRFSSHFVFKSKYRSITWCSILMHQPWNEFTKQMYSGLCHVNTVAPNQIFFASIAKGDGEILILQGNIDVAYALHVKMDTMRSFRCY